MSDYGDHLTWLEQYALADLGFYQGKLDGVRGPMTRAARDAWERSIEVVNECERTICGDGLHLVKTFEGLYLKAYKCPAGVWTIGYGHTGLTHRDGSVYAGLTITEQRAEELLRHDLTKFAKRVQSLVKVPLNDDEFSALVSFDFNTGALHKSTLLAKLNAGDRQGAADEFLKWNRGGGRVLKGLTRRRKSERNLFLSIRPFIVT